MTDLFGAPMVTPAQARRKLKVLKEQRTSRYVSGPCERCGGAGGHDGWPGYVCYRCGGRNPMHHETYIRWSWPTPELEAQAQELEAIIEAEEARKAEIRARKAQAEQRERDHAAAIREDAWRTERAQTPHTGEVGKRTDLSGEVLAIRDVNGRFGPARLVIIREDTTEAIVKSFSTADAVWDLRQGDRIRARATVKAHESWQGERQTMVTRLAVQEVEPQTEDAD